MFSSLQISHNLIHLLSYFPILLVFKFQNYSYLQGCGRAWHSLQQEKKGSEGLFMKGQ